MISMNGTENEYSEREEKDEYIIQNRREEKKNEW